MSVRNLDKLFKPRSVALIGATPRPGAVGALVARNLRRAGFAGELMFVNPHHHAIEGVRVCPTVAALRHPPDLAIIVTPPESVPPLIGELAERGTRAAVVITAGFGELGNDGRALQQAALDAAKPHLLRIVGPNCVGVMVPGIGLDATFSHLAAPAGDIAFVSQSGALITAMLDWAAPRTASAFHMSYHSAISLTSLSDMLALVAADQRPGRPLLVEGIIAAVHARQARLPSRSVLVLKAGWSMPAPRPQLSYRAWQLPMPLRATFTAACCASRRWQLWTRRNLALVRDGQTPRHPDRSAAVAASTRTMLSSPPTLIAPLVGAMAELNRVLPATWSHGRPG